MKNLLRHIWRMLLNPVFREINELNSKLCQVLSKLESIEVSMGGGGTHRTVIDTQNLRFCPACNKISEFLPMGVNPRKNAKCPFCYSLERGRALWLYLQRNTKILDEIFVNKLEVLHFAPERFFYDKFSNCSKVNYFPVDFNPKFKGIRDVVDIQKIQYENEKFNIIICIHVLEHIPDDNTAMKELLRVLKKSGAAYIMVPISKSYSTTFEDSAHSTPELRLKHYGQSDHVRRYGMDFEQRLVNAGFTVNTIKTEEYFSERERAIYGIIPDYIFECSH